MSGHSKKKAEKSAGTAKKIYLGMIYFATGFYLIIHLYRHLISKQEGVFSRREITDFIILSIINYVLYRLLMAFRNSYWDSYLLDFLGINVLVEILINYSKKFWYIYLIYPGFLMMWALKACYGYVSNIGKSDGTEEEEEELNTKNKYRDSGHQTKQTKDKKQKVKYVKH